MVMPFNVLRYYDILCVISGPRDFSFGHCLSFRIRIFLMAVRAIVDVTVPLNYS